MTQRHFLKATRFALGALVALMLASGPASAASPQPLDPQPATDDLQPGLSVRYYQAFFRLIDELLEWKQENEGVPGEPIPDINSNVGAGTVLTSGIEDGVGAEISGLIRFDAPGSYSFVAQSNDGVQLKIGGVLVLEDPDVHSDRYSAIARLEVPAAGWYPLEMLYFERKSTSTIELYWKAPDNAAGNMAIVPAGHFAHLKAE